ncbi:hypothetical protein [Fictibacillus barbaricus]|uniref:Choloylglycine hydrolase/NAAA C-terminal domain-containing protein n=1 Tax=Fictibacillus barbaricus TaxID=182136 RepID=A0ABU1TWA4_9BACL|nr:hypothetical protein [Fictibacillus barbaricus]MDR7071465.1 hypothetical protein [Fictibacillus barbaricus]
MCTSFALHAEKTYIGMNFDISDRPIKMALIKDNQLIIFQKENGSFFPAFGLNRNGTFMNLLMVDPNENGKYRRGKNCVHIMKLFDDVLSERIEVSSLNDYLTEKKIVNVPNYSVHSMIAGIDRHSFVVEPGRENLSLDSFDQDFMVLTNFPFEADQYYNEVSGDGSDRYQKAYHSLLNCKESFQVNEGFSILEGTIQTEGDYPTQLSMISVPEEQVIYFTLKGNFNKIFMFSFHDNQIQTHIGFEFSNHHSLSKKGILLSELESW